MPVRSNARYTDSSSSSIDLDVGCHIDVPCRGYFSDLCPFFGAGELTKDVNRLALRIGGGVSGAVFRWCSGQRNESELCITMIVGDEDDK